MRLERHLVYREGTVYIYVFSIAAGNVIQCRAFLQNKSQFSLHRCDGCFRKLHKDILFQKFVLEAIQAHQRGNGRYRYHDEMNN